MNDLLLVKMSAAYDRLKSGRVDTDRLTPSNIQELNRLTDEQLCNLLAGSASSGELELPSGSRVEWMSVYEHYVRKYRKPMVEDLTNKIVNG